MKTLLKNGKVINVFTGEIYQENVLIEDDKIIGVGDYQTADIVEDVTGCYICPGFIDGHIHIESTMMTPSALTRALLPCGTTAIVADPHEIANVCGIGGIEYMLQSSEGLPLKVFITLPSCVPSTPFDESGATLNAEDLAALYSNPRVLGLAEVMNYPGVLSEDDELMKKLTDAKRYGKSIDGHAPLLTGKDLDKYIAAGIESDHECSSFAEASERIKKGQWVMIREGTAAKNLNDLIGLFDKPWNNRCLLVTDDRHPIDILTEGHIDHIIRLAVKNGKSAVTAIQMATIQAAQRFGISDMGAVAPGYKADVLVLSDLQTVSVRDVYCSGQKVVSCGKVLSFPEPTVSQQLIKTVSNSFFVKQLAPKDFHIKSSNGKFRVINTIPGQLLTEEWITEIDGDDNSVDLKRDILKVAVIERHMNTGHIGLGFIHGLGLKEGAFASSVSHDSHNIVVIGTNDEDMAVASNRIVAMGGGIVSVKNGKVVSELALPIGGLTSDKDAEFLAQKNDEVLESIYKMGVPKTVTPLMTTAFMSLSVIPHLKLTSLGLVDVDSQKLVPLLLSED